MGGSGRQPREVRANGWLRDNMAGNLKEAKKPVMPRTCRSRGISETYRTFSYVAPKKTIAKFRVNFTGRKGDNNFKFLKIPYLKLPLSRGR